VRDTLGESGVKTLSRPVNTAVPKGLDTRSH